MQLFEFWGKILQNGFCLKAENFLLYEMRDFLSLFHERQIVTCIYFIKFYGFCVY